MRRRWTVFCAGALVVFAGCGVDGERQAAVVEDRTVPFGLLEPDAPPLLPTTSPAPTQPVSLCFVEANRLAVVTVRLAPPIDVGAAIAALDDPPDTGGTLRTAVADPRIVGGVRVVEGIAQVDLLPTISALGSEDQLLAIAQLVCTLTAQPGVGQVSFTLEGAPVDVPTADGSLTAAPVSREDYASLLT